MFVPQLFSEKIKPSPKVGSITRKTQRNERQYYHTLTYNRSISYYGNDKTDRLLGSCLNRRKTQAAKKAALQLGKKNDECPNGSTDGISSDYIWIERQDLHETIRNTCKAKNPLCISHKVAKSHTMSKRTAQKIREKMSAFYDSSPSSVFLTLTFINKVTDQQAVSCLNKFWTAIKKKVDPVIKPYSTSDINVKSDRKPKFAKGIYRKFVKGVKIKDPEKSLQYIWVAERQKASTGNVHFHCMINRYLPIAYVNKLWVMQQYNDGITHPDYSKETIQTLYNTNKMQGALNPVDVRKITGADGLSDYLTEYLTNEQDEFQCRLWHCSRGVSELYTKCIIGTDAINEIRSKKNMKVNKETGEVTEAKTYESKYHTTTYLVNKKYFRSKYLNELIQVNKWIMQGKKYQVPDIDSETYRKLYINDSGELERRQNIYSSDPSMN